MADHEAVAGSGGWPSVRRSARCDDGFAAMVGALRLLQDRVTAAVPPSDVAHAMADRLLAVAGELDRYAVEEFGQVAGKLTDIPGRAHALIPVSRLDRVSLGEHGERFTGTVTFRRFHLGGGGAVHGGVIPLLFDDVLGEVANSGGRSPARTAYLHVDYRSIIPVDQELLLTVDWVSESGRKRVLRGTVHDGDRLCAKAEGLFVELLPGQP